MQQYFYSIGKRRILSNAEFVEQYRDTHPEFPAHNTKQKLHEAYLSALYQAEQYIMEYVPHWKQRYNKGKLYGLT